MSRGIGTSSVFGVRPDRVESYRRRTRWASRLCIKNTAHVRHPVRENSTSWRKLEGSASTSVQRREFRILGRVVTAFPPMGSFSPTTKPAKVLTSYPGADTWFRIGARRAVCAIRPRAAVEIGQGRQREPPHSPGSAHAGEFRTSGDRTPSTRSATAARLPAVANGGRPGACGIGVECASLWAG